MIFPIDWGLHDAYNFYLCPDITYLLSHYCNESPLSLSIEVGSPYLSIISLRRALATSGVFLVGVRKVPTQFKKVSTKTSNYLKFPVVCGSWVKSVCQSSQGHFSICCTPIGKFLLLTFRLVFVQIGQV